MSSVVVAAEVQRSLRGVFFLYTRVARQELLKDSFISEPTQLAFVQTTRWWHYRYVAKKKDFDYTAG